MGLEGYVAYYWQEIIARVKGRSDIYMGIPSPLVIYVTLYSLYIKFMRFAALLFQHDILLATLNKYCRPLIQKLNSLYSV